MEQLSAAMRNASAMLKAYAGMSADEADARFSKWDWDKMYPAYADLSEEAVSRFKAAGVSAQVFYDACKFLPNAAADKDGKSVSGSKKQKVMDYVASPDIPVSQKDSLWDAIKGNWKGSWR